MSLLLASTLMLSSKPSGSLNEMVLVEGLRFGRIARVALQQRVVKEDLLSLCLANMIFFFAFPGITIVPVEPVILFKLSIEVYFQNIQTQSNL